MRAAESAPGIHLGFPYQSLQLTEIERAWKVERAWNLETVMVGGTE